MAHLSLDTKGNAQGNPRSKRRLQTIIMFAYKWFGLGAFLFSIILIPSGAFFFNSNNFLKIPFDILIPWVLLVVLTALNLLLTTSTAIIEGTGKISEVIGMKLLQSLLSSFVLWFFLAKKAGLYSLVFSSMIGLIVGVLWLFIRLRNFFIDILRHKSKERGINWRREIFPFQWRIAVSWMSGYFVFYSLTPILFKQSGAEVAGQFGASMQLFSVLNGGAIIWISTKMPIFGMLAAKNNYEKLRTLFFRSFFQSTAMLVIAISLAGAFYWYLVSINAAIVSKILPLNALALLAICSLLNHIVFSMAAYLRSHKKEPFMLISVLNSLCTFSLSLLLVPYYNYMGAVLSYLAGNFFFGFLGGGLIFLKDQKRRY
jgi:O-antigen/teichoic acid export membrane protein